MEFKKYDNRVNLYIDGRLIGFATFPNVKENVVVINHTIVYPQYQKQGYASKILEVVVEILKETNRKCQISCSYALSWFKKHPEYKELLD